MTVIILLAAYLICLGVLAEHRLAWYYAIPLFLISPVFVPFYLGYKVAQI